MKIGELAKKTDCHVETIRYYQKVGLLKKANRLPNGYGDYTAQHLAQLTLIRRAKDLGFSQKDVSGLVELARRPRDSCTRVRALTVKQLDNVRGRIEVLNQMKSALEVMMVSCDQNTLSDCPALTDLLDVGSIESGKAKNSDH